MKKIITLLCFAVAATSLSAQSLEQRLKSHIEILASEEFKGRESGTAENIMAATYVRDEFAKIEGFEFLTENGFQDVTFEVTRGGKRTINSVNVVGMVKASKKNTKGKYITIGAHFDHIGVTDEGLVNYGADDNASGTAYIIELARRYAEKSDELDYDILFIAFTGEEMGLKGSRYYAENPLLPLKDCKAMINFDMLGRMTRNGITVRGLGTSIEAVYLFNSVENKDELEIVWEFRGKGPTDYSSFYAKEIPAFSFSTRLHKDYHLPTDTADKINYEGMLFADNYISQIIDKLLSKKVKMTYKVEYE
ncbi:MAG: M28 family peptidase [Rikenellaceae bacterium]